MTKFLKNIALLTLIMMSATGCFKEQFDGEQIQEGVPTEVSLNFDVMSNQLVTRAAQAEEYEFKVYSLYLYVFDNHGAVIYRHFFDQAGAATDRYGNEVDLAFDSAAADKGTLKFKTVTALDAKIVAIANVTETAVSETAYTLTESMLDDVNSYSALQELVMRGQESVARGSIFMMTGVARDSGGNEAIDITSSGTPLNCTIQLDRADAKVEFRIVTGTPAAGVTNLSFAPNQWRVINVPKESMVLPKAGNYSSAGVLITDADVAAGAQHFDTEWYPFEIKSTVGQPVNGFTFYMPENRQVPREIINVAGVEGVKLREDKLQEDLSQDQIDNTTRPGHIFNNTEFRYAGTDATYAEFTGTLSYIQDGTYVNVLARFTVHLGQTQKSGAYTPNDYETKRNTHYVYNIRVNGANDIEVEVKDSTPEEEVEENPGYTGEIVKNSNYVYELDSHFERRVFAVDKNMIDEKMTWGVSTLYSRGLHDYESPHVETELRDYKWVKFAINYEHGTDANKFVTYPGNQNYYDPDAAVGLIVGTTVYPEGYSTTAVSEKPLYDVNQLVDRLKAIKSNSSYFDSNDKVWVTAFIDEYVYYKNPITYVNAAGNKNNQAGYTSFWKNTVNTQERLLHFITTDAKYSPDGESSVVNTVFTFKQKAIKSLFNVNAATSTSWGIENLQEGKRLPTEGSNNLYATRGLSASVEAGRQNTMVWWSQGGGLQFNSVMNNNATVTDANGVTGPDPYAYNSTYAYVPYACLNRNRDENGNGRIDESEVRWYLASVRNIVDFFIGQSCFDDSEHLYPGVNEVIRRNDEENNPAARGYFVNTYSTDNISWHYGTSTPKDNDCDIVWAEEACATGSYYWSAATSGGGIGNDIFAYRCVRDLGAHYNQGETVTVDHLYEVSDGTSQVTVEGQNYTVKTIDLSLYNPTSLRTNKETNELPVHTESGTIVVDGQTISENGNSKPYNSFQYIYNTQTGTGRIYGQGQSWAQVHATNPCPDGWRMPNVRELAVMAMLEPGNGWQSYSTTRYSLQSYFTNTSNRDARHSFEYYSGNLSTEDHANHGTRCVRDYDGN